MKFGEVEVVCSPYLPEGTWLVADTRTFKYPAGFVPPLQQADEEATPARKLILEAERQKHENNLLDAMRKAGLPEPVREYKFVFGRRFSADFCFVTEHILIEVEGGHWTGGRHRSREGYAKDCEKYNLAALGGWTLLRFTPEMIEDGSAVKVIGLALEKAGK